MADPIQQAIDYAHKDDDGSAYQLCVKLTDGSTLTGVTYGASSAHGIGVTNPDDADETYIHFINPAHILWVKVEWL